ncbi:MAG TPA: 4Fe-4S dicluster domain-containing protein [Thermoplasmata archaeon]|nr:4Fe-4S dicluster domain-containing protein [Thermoplasmata archaeon]
MDLPKVGERRVLERHDFPSLFHALRAKGYQVVGPTVRDGAIVYDHLSGVDDLPIGWTDHQSGGKYRLERRNDEALFGYTVGPFSWKKFLYPSRERLWTARKDADSFVVTPEPTDGSPLAFFGMRACELAGVAIQDRVFMGGPAVDPGYAARRSRILRIAVQCGQAGGTCFCVSMGTGPGVRAGGADLILTEILEPHRHYFLVEVGSPEGAAVIAELPLKLAASDDPTKAEAVVARAAASMGRTMETDGIHDLLLNHLEHPRWEVVARRCLSCTNCTMVCPTCFCSTQEEVPNLSVETVERWRRWDSCFNLGLTEMHGQAVRKSGLSRYRQWLTHKLASWQDQFGTSGCVGCGRCITWCPVGIDLTEEVAAIRMAPAPAATSEGKK